MVSVCIPIYNSEKYLARSIDSIANQTYLDLEIILIDDGSTDLSGSICDQYAKKDDRIQVIHKSNGGEASARNAGLDNAKGDYVCFCDSDDNYTPNAIKSMLQEIEQNDADFSFGAYLEKEDEKVCYATAHMKKYSPNDIAANIIDNKGTYGDLYIFSTVNGKMFKSSIIFDNNLRFNESFIVGNDSIFICDYVSSMRKCGMNTFTPVYEYYKYNVEDRMQGMGWLYPDAFLLNNAVKKKLLEIHIQDEKESKNRIIVDYMSLIHDLVNLVKYESILNFKIEDYLDYCRLNVPWYVEGAFMEEEHGVIRDKNKYDIPFKIVSHLIYEMRDNELAALMRLMNPLRDEFVLQNMKIRQMLKINSNF